MSLETCDLPGEVSAGDGRKPVCYPLGSRMNATLEKPPASLSILKEKINLRAAVVGILGLGYVGLPLALVFEEADAIASAVPRTNEKSGSRCLPSGVGTQTMSASHSSPRMRISAPLMLLQVTGTSWPGARMVRTGPLGEEERVAWPVKGRSGIEER